MYKHILIPTDGSTLSLKAAKAGAKLAKELNARVTALYVIPPYAPPTGGEGIVYQDLFSEKRYLTEMKKHADKAVAKVKAEVESQQVACQTVAEVERTPWEAIINAAKHKKCDLIVMASHGRRGLASLLLGSETTKVLTHSKTPVLVCR